MNISLENAKKECLTIKNLKTFTGHDGMQGINADIYKDGIKFCHVYDDAWGGPLDIKPHGSVITDKEGNYSISPELSKNKDVLKELEKKFPYAKDYDNCLEGVLNALISEGLEQKELKKSEKKGIVMEGSIMTWKAGTISNMLKKFYLETDNVVAMVQKGYDECIADGEKVLNTVYLKSIGIKI